jgi:hypothetical protein
MIAQLNLTKIEFFADLQTGISDKENNPEG